MYKAIVSAITVRPHPNADRLQLGLVHGHQVVVSLDVKDGDLGVFFPTDGQLSGSMCVYNNLYNQSACAELNLISSPSFGFFDVKRRVRAQRFRGEKSDGFWCELDKLKWTGADLTELKSGDTIDSLNGVLVCEKYYTPATIRAMRGGTKPQDKKVEVVFPKHKDTEQFRYCASSIPMGAIIYITEKLHGTSGRFGNVIERTKLSGLKRLWNRLKGGDGTQSRYVHLNGSKNVTLREATIATDNGGFYGTHEFRYNVTENLTLHKGEIVYFEIVGYVNEITPIMPPQAIKKELKVVQYGDTMRFTYGCEPGEHRMFVYRITRVNEDGIETDLSWVQTKARAKELGLKTVPELEPVFIYDGIREGLAEKVEQLVEGASTVDSRHMREGVVVRSESEWGTGFLKSKSWLFGVLEGYIKDNTEYVDTEEAS